MTEFNLNALLATSLRAARGIRIAELEYDLALYSATTVMIFQLKQASAEFARAVDLTDYSLVHRVVLQAIRASDRTALDADREALVGATPEKVLNHLRLIAKDGKMIDFGGKAQPQASPDDDGGSDPQVA